MSKKPSEIEVKELHSSIRQKIIELKLNSEKKPTISSSELEFLRKAFEKPHLVSAEEDELESDELTVEAGDIEENIKITSFKLLLKKYLYFQQTQTFLVNELNLGQLKSLIQDLELNEASILSEVTKKLNTVIRQVCQNDLDSKSIPIITDLKMLDAQLISHKDFLLASKKLCQEKIDTLKVQALRIKECLSAFSGYGDKLTIDPQSVSDSFYSSLVNLESIGLLFKESIENLENLKKIIAELLDYISMLVSEKLSNLVTFQKNLQFIYQSRVEAEDSKKVPNFNTDTMEKLLELDEEKAEPSPKITQNRPVLPEPEKKPVDFDTILFKMYPKVKKVTDTYKIPKSQREIHLFHFLPYVFIAESTYNLKTAVGYIEITDFMHIKLFNYKRERDLEVSHGMGFQFPESKTSEVMFLIEAYYKIRFECLIAHEKGHKVDKALLKELVEAEEKLKLHLSVNYSTVYKAIFKLPDPLMMNNRDLIFDLRYELFNKRVSEELASKSTIGSKEGRVIILSHLFPLLIDASNEEEVTKVMENYIKTYNKFFQKQSKSKGIFTLLGNTSGHTEPAQTDVYKLIHRFASAKCHFYNKIVDAAMVESTFSQLIEHLSNFLGGYTAVYNKHIDIINDYKDVVKRIKDKEKTLPIPAPKHSSSSSSSSSFSYSSSSSTSMSSESALPLFGSY